MKFMRIWFILEMVAIYRPIWAAMPAKEQNALVKRYCAVCHTDAARNGGSSLEHYDATKPEPTLAAMILRKLNVPDKDAQQALISSTREQAGGALDWKVSSEDGLISAGIVRKVPPKKPDGGDEPVYRLQMVCRPAEGNRRNTTHMLPSPQTGSASGTRETIASRSRREGETASVFGQGARMAVYPFLQNDRSPRLQIPAMRPPYIFMRNGLAADAAPPTRLR